MNIEFRLPELGENVYSGTVAKVLVAQGDSIKSGQNVLEIETDKAVAEIPCPFSGKVVDVRAKEGKKINVGDIVLVIEEGAAVIPEEQKPVAGVTQVSSVQPKAINALAKISGGTVRATPSVRKLAREHGVSLEEVPYSDQSGKVTAQDVLDYIALRENSAETPVNMAQATTEAIPERIKDKWGYIVAEPMNAIRRKAAEHLTHCWTTIPHVTHFDKADITELEAFRKQYGTKAEKVGVRLTVTAFLLKLLPDIFKKFPRMNASVDMEHEQILLKQYYHIGVAVDTENGLVVPVIRHVDTKSVVEIAREMAHLAAKARERKLSLEDMQGGGFTVSNLGGLGGYAFTPIINAPETAILGVSRSAIEPVYRNNTFEPRLMLPLSFSYDHRCIDGADAARFTRYLCEALEHPWRLSLGL